MANRVLLLTLFFFSMTLSSSTNPKHFTLELIHRDSPHSPLYNPQATHTDHLHSAFLRSISRSRRFNHHKPQTDLRSGLIGAGGEFFMSIAIGTPPTNVLATADTGSDLTWVQCKPCQHCYKENGPIFDSKKSASYKNEPCDSSNCKDLSTKDRGCDESKDICKYRYSYGDGSFTRGDVAKETVSIGSASGPPVSFPGTVFGCGHDNGGLFDETGSGIVGLGGGNLSLVSQLGSEISNKFSYCLSRKSSTLNGTGVINLGTHSIPSVASKVKSTPLVDKEPKTYYYLTLEAISVGNTKIPYTGSIKNYPNGEGVSKGNIIIDSGTTYTLLESGFFDKFGAKVEESVTGAKRVSDPQGLLSYCFKSESADHQIGLPEITVHFSGADLRLSALNSFVKVNKDVVCLTMIPTNDVAIYGNFAQMEFLVGYDLQKRRVLFQPMDCSAHLSM